MDIYGNKITDTVTINVVSAICLPKTISKQSVQVYEKSIKLLKSSKPVDSSICSNPTKTPTITLNDSSIIDIIKGKSYVELNATAYDEEDKDLTNKIKIDSSEVNTSKVGTYKVYYRVTDSEYIQVEEVRTVNVMEKKECQNNTSTPPNGLFTLNTTWKNENISLLATNPLMEEQSKSCNSYNLGSGNLSLDEVYQGHYAININPTNLASIDESNLPDTVTVTINTPSGTRVYKKEIKTKDDYNLGHIADIVIVRADPSKPAVVELVPTQTALPIASNSSSGGNGGQYQYVNGSGASWSSYPVTSLGSSVSTPQEILNIERELCSEADQSCGCLPCEYRILSFLNQAQLGGAIAGANYRLYKASDFRKQNIEYLHEGQTTVGTDIDSSGIITFPVVLEGQENQTTEEISFMQEIANHDGDFIVEVVGGVDVDANSDFEIDSEQTPVRGVLHAIISKEQLLRNEYKVNVLTELSFQVSQDVLGVNYDFYQLDGRLNEIARKVLVEKLYPSSANPLSRDDIVYWLASANQNWLVKDYATQLLPIIQKIYKGENVSADAREFIYAELSILLNPNPVLGATWVQVSEELTGAVSLGEMRVISQGSSNISSYSLVNESSLFSISNSGVVSLKAGMSLKDEASSQYDLLVKASNENGTSRAVTFRVLVSRVDKSLVFTTFKDGHVREDAQSGDYVGQVVFDETHDSVTGYELGGINKDEFDIDSSGKITVKTGADLDYEKYRVKHVEVTALGAIANSRPQRITIFIDDVLDVPRIQAQEVHIGEDKKAGAVIATYNVPTKTNHLIQYSY